MLLILSSMFQGADVPSKKQLANCFLASSIMGILDFIMSLVTASVAGSSYCCQKIIKVLYYLRNYLFIDRIKE